jgi:hypothetical protein
VSDMNAEETGVSRSEAEEKSYLNIWGDSAPLLSPGYGRGASPHGDATGISPYEYFWTLGIVQASIEPSKRKGPKDMGQHVRHPRRSELEPKMETAMPRDRHGCAHVSLHFPRNNGFWVHEIAASVKLLSPPPPDFAEKLGADVKELQPLIGLAGGAVAAVGTLGGPVVSAAGHVLDAVAKAKLNDVPSTKEFPWSVQQFSTADSDVVVWNLPQNMFTLCGDRITGSIAVVFLPTPPSDVPPATFKIRGEASFGPEPGLPPDADGSFEISLRHPASADISTRQLRGAAPKRASYFRRRAGDGHTFFPGRRAISSARGRLTAAAAASTTPADGPAPGRSGPGPRPDTG